MTKTPKNKLSEDYTYIPLDDNRNYFYSYDIALVSYLLYLKHELVSLDKAVKGKVLFIIKRKPNTDEAIKDFWAFNTSIDAQSYFNQLKRVKNQIFSS